MMYVCNKDVCNITQFATLQYIGCILCYELYIKIQESYVSEIYELKMLMNACLKSIVNIQFCNNIQMSDYIFTYVMR